MKNILVTGSSGCVGTRLAEKLFEGGYKVIGLDIRENPFSSKINKSTIKVDLRSRRAIFSKVPHSVDAIIHLAANSRVPPVVKNPKLALDNIAITFNLLEFARAKGIKRFIFSSTQDVYGELKNNPSEGCLRLDTCTSPYAASKIAAEALILSYNKCYGIDFLIFRFSSIYGMYDSSRKVIPIFIKLCREGRDLVVNGADKVLDLVHVDDLAAGVICCLRKFSKAKNNTFNIGFGKGNSLLKVARIIKKSVGSKNKIIVGVTKKGEISRLVLDISKARKLVNYRPKIDLEGGIRKAIAWRERSAY